MLRSNLTIVFHAFALLILLVVSISSPPTSSANEENSKTGMASPKVDAVSNQKFKRRAPAFRLPTMGLNMAFTQVLLIPSLTKNQQTRIRTLYFSYRLDRLKLWKEFLQNFSDQSSKTKAARTIQAPERQASAAIGEEILFSMVNTKTDPVSDHHVTEVVQDFQKRSATVDTIAERDLLAVLTPDQHKELHDITEASKTRDLFVKLSEDIEKLGHSPPGTGVAQKSH